MKIVVEYRKNVNKDFNIDALRYLCAKRAGRNTAPFMPGIIVNTMYGEEVIANGEGNSHVKFTIVSNMEQKVTTSHKVKTTKNGVPYGKYIDTTLNAVIDIQEVNGERIVSLHFDVNGNRYYCIESIGNWLRPFDIKLKDEHKVIQYDSTGFYPRALWYHNQTMYFLEELKVGRTDDVLKYLNQYAPKYKFIEAIGRVAIYPPEIDMIVSHIKKKCGNDAYKTVMTNYNDLVESHYKDVESGGKSIDEMKKDFCQLLADTLQK